MAGGKIVLFNICFLPTIAATTPVGFTVARGLPIDCRQVAEGLICKVFFHWGSSTRLLNIVQSDIAYTALCILCIQRQRINSSFPVHTPIQNMVYVYGNCDAVLSLTALDGTGDGNGGLPRFETAPWECTSTSASTSSSS